MEVSSSARKKWAGWDGLWGGSSNSEILFYEIYANAFEEQIKDFQCPIFPHLIH